MVDYKILSEMLEEALAKETSESWNVFLDDCYEDSHQIDVVSTLEVSALLDNEPMVWEQGGIVEGTVAEKGAERDGNNPYAIAA